MSPLAATHAGLVLVRRFQDRLAREKLLPRGSKIIIAVSGGSDSMALLTLLARLRAKHTFTLHIAHVNYGLRGRDSERDEALVKKTAEKYNLEYSILRSKAKPTKNIEETLRNIRYAYFEKLRRKLGYDYVVTAHTADDVAETVLLNLLRGAGLIGLSPFQRPLPHIVRPLITFRKSELEGFLRNESVPFRIDRSNQSPRFTRNRIRHELIPLLETFNPRIIETLTKTAQNIGRLEKDIISPDSDA